MEGHIIIFSIILFMLFWSAEGWGEALQKEGERKELSRERRERIKLMKRIAREDRRIPHLKRDLDELLLLALLGGQERYGLELIAALKGVGKRVGYGTLYPALHRLENDGLIESYWGPERLKERNGARRRYYKITGLGKEVVEEKQKQRASIVAWQFGLQPVWGNS